MTKKEALTTLVRYQQWRKDIIPATMEELFTPTEVGEALDVAIEVMRGGGEEKLPATWNLEE